MRFQVTKILDNISSNEYYFNTNIDLLEKYNISHILMLKKINANSFKLWFGKLSIGTCRLTNPYFFGCYEEFTAREMSDNLSYGFIGVDEEWYGITEKAYDMLCKLTSKKELDVILDNLEIIGEINDDFFRVLNFTTW